MLGLGGAFAFVGTGLIVAGAVTHKNPVDEPAMRKLADEHNQRLRRELGLPAEAQRSARAVPRRRPALDLALTPDLRAAGGYATARVRF